MTREEITKEVLKMWAEGAQSGKIAAALNLTRGRVMGLVHRAQRMGKAEKRPRQRKTPVAKPAAKPVRVKGVSLAPVSIQHKQDASHGLSTPQQQELPLYQPKTLMQLKSLDCRWIRPDGKYCGHPAKSAKTPWCDHHYGLVYVKGTNFSLKKSAVKAS